MNPEELGPLAYENWKAFLEGKDRLMVSEYPLFTDAHIVGEVRDKYGPYQLLNTVAAMAAGESVPAIVLRVGKYVENTTPQRKETNFGRYHGGSLSDELAALLSLCMGVRVKAGDETRWFLPDDDPMGKPINLHLHNNPILIKRAPQNAILPSALGTHNIEHVQLIETLPRLSVSAAIALVRAARLYQDAIWIIESEPQLSWILLVSAIEIAAGQWVAAEYDVMEAFRESCSELVAYLEETAGQEAVERVAQQFGPYLKSSKKFRDFIRNFLPPPPTERPDEIFRVSWAPRNIKDAMVKIYEYRSNALHAGIPFPPSMSMRFGLKEEKPAAGMSVVGQGGTWLAKDTPMLIHIFEYIVRNSLLKWWGAMITDVY